MRPGDELLQPLREHSITKVVVAGLKAGQGVLSACQALMDEGLLVYVVRDCVADDHSERAAAVLDHVIPQFADVMNFAEFREQISNEIMIDMFVEMKTAQRAG
uniref:Isochorismatase-like domain-containing protein n=1 Tax=Alexandrium andersonii TaxID=327968 RepID=A0A7S2IEK5_9DINO